MEEGSDESGRILALEKAWNEAGLKHDARALSMLLAETFAYTDSDGTFMERSQWLAHVKNEVDQYEQLANSGMTAHVYGSAAVVTGKYHEKIRVEGKVIVRAGRFTDTWIQQNAEWKCVASQATLTNP
jgi:ketosteroid isomerase-like protein